jgi:hypothetical protein
MAEDSTLMTETQPDQTNEVWYSDDYKDVVTQQGWKDPNDVVRDYTELQKSASGKIRIPAEGASQEEVSNFYAKIRGVDTPEGYEVKVPENVPMDQETINKLRQWAFEAGTPKVAFDTVLKNYLDDLSQQAIQSLESAKKELQDEWKDDYNVNFEMADRFVTNECSKEFRQVLVDSGLHNHPVFVREFLSLAKKTATDTLIKGDTKGDIVAKDYVPAYPNSPDMYKNGDDEESKKARAFFIAKGHVY